MIGSQEAHDNTCPNCGYCKHCGRSSTAPPAVPYYPYPYPVITSIPPSIYYSYYTTSYPKDNGL